ncbi:hypothetical protein GCM10026982_26470 [Nocardiopsis aegyptia]
MPLKETELGHGQAPFLEQQLCYALPNLGKGLGARTEEIRPSATGSSPARPRPHGRPCVVQAGLRPGPGGAQAVVVPLATAAERAVAEIVADPSTVSPS